MTPVVFPQLPGNGHLRAVLDCFGEGTVAADEIPPHSAVLFLCFTNRSGSNLLAHALASSGQLNLAGELLNAEAVRDDVARHGWRRFADFFCSQWRWRMVGGRFAIKLALPHLEVLGRAGVLDLVRRSARYVFMERADRLGQAISYEIARRSGQWTSETVVAVAPGAIAYAREGITAALETFAAEKRQFDLFFGRNGIVPVQVLYEHLLADPAGVVRAVGQAAGLDDLAYLPERVAVRRQAGALNACWRQRYLAGR
jgi:LPS sulfotransferase NodH